MALPRPPGDNSVKERFDLRNWEYKYSLGGYSTGFQTNKVELSRRPTYSKGVVIALPGGGKFIKSTNYSHTSWVILPVAGPARLNSIDGSKLTDNGRESGLIIFSEPKAFSRYPPTDARNEAATKALTKIADQKVNLGENLATLHQTIKMFTSRSELLRDALNTMRKDGSISKFLGESVSAIKRKGPLTESAKLYLEYIYGLKPLVDDVLAAAKLMSKQAKEPLLLKAVGKAARQMDVKPGSNLLGSWSTMRRMAGSGNLTVKCTLWARVNPDLEWARTLNQFGLINPIAIAWELVPYSFVVDWFVPIGDLVYAMTAPMGLLFVDGSIGTRTSEVIHFSYEIRNGGVNPLGEKTPTVVSVVHEGYYRTALATWPQAGLYFVKDPFKMDRPLKALALTIVGLSKQKFMVR